MDTDYDTDYGRSAEVGATATRQPATHEPSPSGLGPSGECQAQGAVFDPSRITAMLEGIDEKVLQPIIRKAADEFYCTALETAQDYLLSNLDDNLTAHVDMLQRENQRMRTELYEADNALGCRMLTHGARLDAIREMRERRDQAQSEVWTLRSRLASAMSAGTAETGTGSGLQPASAVPAKQGDAQ